MKKMLMTLMTMALVVAGLTVVEAKDRSKTITFLNDVTVNGTQVAKGRYDVRFDSQTNEISILRQGRLIATTQVEVKLTDRKNPYNTAGFVERDNQRLLTTITFAGDKRVLHVNQANGTQNAGE